MDVLRQLFLQHFAQEPHSTAPITPHASQRQLLRLSAPSCSAVGVKSPHIAENKAFIGFTEHFKKLNLPVPSMYKIADDSQYYLQEDLGDQTLYEYLLSSRTENDVFPANVEQLYHNVVKWLVKFQVLGVKNLPLQLCYEGDRYDSDAMMTDMLKFCSDFLDPIALKYDAAALKKDFEQLKAFLAEADSDYFLYRDFQSRNIMLTESKDLYFIDYQSGRKGPLQYDLVSLLYQSQAKIPHTARERLFGTYIGALAEVIPVDREQFMRFYTGFVFMRLMQVLGAYGRLGLTLRKPYFLQGIPIAINNLLEVLNFKGLPLTLPVLESVFLKLATYDEVTEKCQNL